MQTQGERKGPTLFIKIQVTLEDIYNGNEVEVFITKRQVCPHCRGSGADDPDHVKTCPKCKGTGYTMQKQQIGPGFYQQFQSTCDQCYGKGKIYTSKCHVCNGRKVPAPSETPLPPTHTHRPTRNENSPARRTLSLILAPWPPANLLS